MAWSGFAFRFCTSRVGLHCPLPPERPMFHTLLAQITRLNIDPMPNPLPEEDEDETGGGGGGEL